MPICTTCTTWIPYLYTVYESAYNLRLEQCPRCLAFADPYVEHDTLTLLIDLILLKRGVYRHLLYNRGAEPRRSVGKGTSTPNPGGRPISEPAMSKDKEAQWSLIIRLGAPLVFVDAFIRWSHLNSGQATDVSPWSMDTISVFTRTLVGCVAETVAFHGGILVSCSLMFLLIDTIRRLIGRSTPMSDIRREFRFSLIPLSLLYSSLTKLFLLFLLTIWRPSPLAPTQVYALHNTTSSNKIYAFALELVDDRAIDREWIVRNILGGMSAGFGLRVILDSHPLVITIVIISGWAAKTVAASFVSSWVGGGEAMEEAWLAYSIP